jgi:hypothetical protein
MFVERGYPVDGPFHLAQVWHEPLVVVPEA